MTSRVGVTIMGVAMLLYIATTVWLAVMFFSVGTAPGIGMGVALLVIAPIGVWALVRELMFGYAADRLGRALDAEGGMPEAPAELTPSGRLRREDVEPLVAEYSSRIEENPREWRAHYRLGVVQDAAGRRKDARASIREAIRLSRARP
ncbi:tetratricopeptide repeat protein [Microbacterium alcoholitolerans]|uniref:tetratricopeptide repeat protein n=1 Tax=unclassified Microbacterium TaxID=2609290 RepID=UPI003D17E3A8